MSKKKTKPILGPKVVKHYEVLLVKFLETRDMFFEKTDYGKSYQYKIYDRMGSYHGRFRNIEKFVKNLEIDKYPPGSSKIVKWYDKKLAADARRVREARYPEYYKMLYEVNPFWFRRRGRFAGPPKDCFKPKRKKVYRTISDTEAATRRIKKRERAAKKSQDRIERKRINRQAYFEKKQSNRPRLAKRKR